MAWGIKKNVYNFPTDPSIAELGAMEMGAQRQQFGHNKQLAAQQYGYTDALAQKQLNARAAESAAARAHASQMAASARAHEAAMQNRTLAQSQGRWNTVVGMINPYLNNGSASGGYFGRGPVGTTPNIDASPIYSPDMIQQQVNAQRAGNDARMVGDIRSIQQGAAGRGFGSRSALAQSLEQNARMANLLANTSNERETRMNAAQTNRDFQLKAQQAQE